MPDSLPWDQITNHRAVQPGSNNAPVLIVGAGLAGSWLARTLAESGVVVRVLEAGSEVANAGSSNPVGMFKPYVTRSDSFAMQFYIEAYQCLQHRLKQWDLREASQFSSCGVLQLVENPYPESPHYLSLSPSETTDHAGMELNANALLFEKAGWLNPAALCRSLLAHENITVHCNHAISDITAIPGHQWLCRMDNHTEITAENVAICTGQSSAELAVARSLITIPARGQLSRFSVTKGTATSAKVINGRSYIIPQGESVVVGATFERGVNTACIKKNDDTSNLDGLKNTTAALSVDGPALESFAGVRATTHDRLPMIGPLPDQELCYNAYADIRHGRPLEQYPALPVHAGLHAITGLGSRGIVTAPFAASLVANFMLGGKAIEQWMPLINPARFIIRQLKRA